MQTGRFNFFRLSAYGSKHFPSQTFSMILKNVKLVVESLLMLLISPFYQPSALRYIVYFVNQCASTEDVFILNKNFRYMTVIRFKTRHVRKEKIM